MAGIKVAELFAELGVQADEKKAKDFFAIIDKGTTSFLGVAAAAVGTGLTFNALLDKITGIAIGLTQFSAQTGLSTRTLQEWQHAGEGMGVRAEETASTIAGLNEQLVAFQMHRGGTTLALAANELEYYTKGLVKIDIMHDKVWTILDKFRQAWTSGLFKGNEGMFYQILGDAGLQGLVKTIQMSDKAYTNLKNSFATFTPQMENTIIRFNSSMKGLGQTITYMFADAFMQMEPQFRNWLTQMQKTIETHRPEIRKFVSIFVSDMKEIGKVAGISWQGIDTFMTKIGGWANGINLLAAALVALKAKWMFFLDIIVAAGVMEGKGSWQQKFDRIMKGTFTGRELQAAYNVGGAIEGEYGGESEQARAMRQRQSDVDFIRFARSTGLFKTFNKAQQNYIDVPWSGLSNEELKNRVEFLKQMPTHPEAIPPKDNKTGAVNKINITVATDTNDPHEHGRIVADYVDRSILEAHNQIYGGLAGAYG
jgi:hypothetical protein